MTVQATAPTAQNLPLRADTSPIDRPEEAGPLVSGPSQPASNIDIGLAIATLSIDSAFERRKNGRNEKTVAERALVASEQKQLASMQEAADEKLSSAHTSAVGEMISGGLSAGGGMISLGTGKSSWSDIGRGGSSAASGAMKMWSSEADHRASEADIRAKAAEQSAGHFKDAIGEAKDDIDASRESVRKSLDFLKEYQAAQSQTQAAALHRA